MHLGGFITATLFLLVANAWESFQIAYDVTENLFELEYRSEQQSTLPLAYGT